MNKRKRKLIALIVDPSVPFGRDIIDGVTRYSLEKGNWVFCTASGLPYLPSNLATHWQGDGLISFASPEIIKICLDRGKPYVNVASYYDMPISPSVTIDNVAVGEMAADHLLSKGLRHLVAVSAVGSERFRGRVDGFVRRGKRAGCDVGQVLLTTQIVEGEIVGTEAEVLKEYLLRQPRPIGIFGIQDYIARVVAETCAEIDIRVPEDAAVIGEGNWPFACTMVRPHLTSIDIGAERIGYRAAKLLDSLMRGRRCPKRPILVPPRQVVQRQSTDMLAIQDEDVQQALRFIQQHESEPIQVADVLREVPIGRRSLEMKFRKVVGRTMHQEIRRSRIEWACRLLTRTDMAVTEIVSASAYASQERFHSAFRREMKTTPLAYRRVRRMP